MSNKNQNQHQEQSKAIEKIGKTEEEIRSEIKEEVRAEVRKEIEDEEGKTEEKKLTFKEATECMEIGHFRLKEGFGKHRIHGQVTCEIQGRKGKRVVEVGDILLCPPYMVRHFMDKFERIDSHSKSQEEMEVSEKPEAPPTMIHKGKDRYDVISATGLKINHGFLSKEEAGELVQSYA